MTTNPVVKNNDLAYLFLNFIETFNDPACISLGRKSSQHFTRNREMTFYKLLCFLIFRDGKYSNQDLTQFYTSIHQMNHRISKQALFKAMRKMNPEVFSYLISQFSKLFYQSNCVKTYRGYFLLAEDGSSIDAPLSSESIDRFNFIINQTVKCKDDVKTVVARMGGLFDITNGFFTSVSIKGWNTSEITLAYDNLKNTLDIFKGQKLIYLADRYYGGIELFQTLQMNGMNYCIRGKTNFYKELVNEIEKDGWITLNITNAWLKRIKNPDVREYMRNQDSVTVRVVKHRLEASNKSGETHHLYFTNLHENEFSSQDIVDLYRMRWDIETHYKFFKIGLEAERFNTKDLDVYLCKILAKIIQLNLISVIKSEVDYQLASKITKRHKDGFRTKFNCLKEHLLNGVFVFAFFSRNMNLIKKILRQVLLSAFKNIVPIRYNRHYQRYGRFMKSMSNYRFTLDGRNKPIVRRTHYGLRTARP